MYKGITPTFTLTLPEDIDLSFASHIYVTLGSSSRSIIVANLIIQQTA